MLAVVDLETLDVLPSTIVLSIGAVKFEPFGEGYETLDLKVTLDSQPGRTASESTAAWWNSPDKAEALKDIIDSPKVSIQDAIAQLAEFLSGVKAVWACDPDFDKVILDDIERTMGLSVKVRYSSWRSIRTVEDLFFGGNQRSPGGLFYRNDVKHNAVEDCILEMRVIRSVYNILKNTEITSMDPDSAFDAFEDRVAMYRRGAY